MMQKWKVAVGLGVSFWEPFLCTRAGVFQQKRKQGGRNGKVQKETIRRKRNAPKTENGIRNGYGPKESTKQNDGPQDDRVRLATERARQPEHKRST